MLANISNGGQVADNCGSRSLHARAIGMTVADTLRGHLPVPFRVLIVEDDPTTRLGLQQLLGAAGYETIGAADLKEGLEALKHFAPDLLILDIRLGEFNGLQILATAARGTPAIVTTGFADPVLEADAMKLGADFLVKPVLPSKLLALVEAKLNAKPGEEAGRIRQSQRKLITGYMPANIQDLPARILDVKIGRAHV